VQETALSAGDEIAIGPVTFTVLIDGQPEQIKPSGKSPMIDVQSSKAEAAASDTQQEESPETIASIEDDDAEVILDESYESDVHTPTTDLDEDEDDDPIAALERLANSRDESKSRKK